MWRLPTSESSQPSGMVSAVDFGFEVVFKTIFGGLGDVIIPHLVSAGSVVQRGLQ